MSNQRLQHGQTQNNVNANLSLGTGSSFSTTVPTAGTINGQFAPSLGAQTNAPSPTTDVVTGAAFVALGPNRATVLVYGLNAAGQIRLAQGGIEPTQPGIVNTPGAFINGPQFPNLPDDFFPLAYVLVRTAPSVTSWIPGTSVWTATGVVSGPVRNVATLPDRPQIS